MHSFLGVPIFVGGMPFGSLYLTEKADGRQFTDQDEESVTTLAKFAGVAIDHARRYTGAAARGDELTRTVAPLWATNEITHAVGGETDLEPHAVRLIRKVIDSAGKSLSTSNSAK